MPNNSPAFIENGKGTPRDRLYYIDWLRVIAILLVFLVHCSKFFDYNTTVVFNTVRSPVLSAFRDFCLLWIMPLFFVLSGAAVFLSKGTDRRGEFIKSRFLRLLVPLIIIGTFIINPPYVYIERIFSGQADIGFFQWYPQFFNGMYGFGGNFAPLGQGTHLWYLEFLFFYSLILFPLFTPDNKQGTSFLSRLSIRFESPLVLFFLFLPVSAVAAIFEIAGLGGVRVMGGWDPISYLLFFSFGYLIFSNGNIGETIKNYGQIFLAVAIILTALLLGSYFGFILNIPGLTRHDLLGQGASLPLNESLLTFVQALRGLAAWCWIIGVLSLGRRILNFNNNLLAYANEAVLPFYILHHTVVYIIGFFIIQQSINISAKFFIIAIISFAAILAIYEILARRLNILRFLFGMKTRNIPKNLHKTLSSVAGIFFVLVLALAILSATKKDMSPLPTKTGLYINEEFGFQFTFPTSMNKPGSLTGSDMLFHIKHPIKTMFLKVRQNTISIDQPLDPQKGKRLFIAVYNEGEFEPLEQIIKSLEFN